MMRAEQSFTQLAYEEGYRIIGTYQAAVTKIEMICPQNHSILMDPSHFKGGNRCPKCARVCPVQAEQHFRHVAQQRHFTILGKYTRCHDKVEMQCPNGHHVMISPSNFKSGHGCRECEASSGEQLLATIFQNLEILAEPQYQYPGSNRRYDYAFQYQGRLVIVEWDGAMHFEDTGYFTQRLTEKQEIDRQKLHAVLSRGDRMIRIDYTWLSRPMSEITAFIVKALQSSSPLVVSTPTMYTWLHPSPLPITREI